MNFRSRQSNANRAGNTLSYPWQRKADFNALTSQLKPANVAADDRFLRQTMMRPAPISLFRVLPRDVQYHQFAAREHMILAICEQKSRFNRTGTERVKRSIAWSISFTTTHFSLFFFFFFSLFSLVRVRWTLNLQRRKSGRLSIVLRQLMNVLTNPSGLLESTFRTGFAGHTLIELLHN